MYQQPAPIYPWPTTYDPRYLPATRSFHLQPDGVQEGFLDGQEFSLLCDCSRSSKLFECLQMLTNKDYERFHLPPKNEAVCKNEYSKIKRWRDVTHR